MFVYSEDGVTVTKLFTSKEPKQHWVQDTPLVGHYEVPSVANGFFPLVLVEQPSEDHVSEIVRQGDEFVQVWTFSQQMLDNRLAREAADAASEAAEAAQISTRNMLLTKLPAVVAASKGNNPVAAVADLAAMVEQLVKEAWVD